MAAVTEDFVRFRGYRTGYRIVGDLAGATNRVPLLMVHGGPGYPWWRPRDDELRLMASGDRPLVSYDQLGCGRSERPADASLWTVDLFLDELATVRDQLGLDRVHLYGWSWGGMLVLAYLLTRPEGVQSVVLASALHSAPLYNREARRLVAELPAPVQATLRRFEEHYRPRASGPAPRAPASAAPTAKGPANPAASPKAPSSAAPTPKQLARKASSLRWADRVASASWAQRLAALASHVAPLRSTAYQVADVAFDHRYICRLDPWPDQLMEMAAGANEQIYETMWGPGAIALAGLRDWDVTARLGEIDIPALVISGRYDPVTPLQAEEQCAGLPRATRVVLEASGHTGILEEPERHWSEVFAFLDRAEASGAA